MTLVWPDRWRRRASEFVERAQECSRKRRSHLAGERGSTAAVAEYAILRKQFMVRLLLTAERKSDRPNKSFFQRLHTFRQLPLHHAPRRSSVGPYKMSKSSM